MGEREPVSRTRPVHQNQKVAHGSLVHGSLETSSGWITKTPLGVSTVVKVNADKKGLVADVHVKTFPSYPVSIMKHSLQEEKPTTKIPAGVLHRDVRRIAVLLPIEEQQDRQQQNE